MGVDAQMLVRVPRKLRPAEVFREAVRIARAFASDTFFIDRPGKGYGRRKKTGRHALTIETKYEQDGDPIIAEPDETLVEVHLWGRYYGPGYERGDLVTILAVARWLRGVWPDGVVWYGGDSSGIVAEPLDAEAEAALWSHYMSAQGRAYFAGRWDNTTVMHDCDFCKAALSSVNATKFYCMSCGGHWQQQPDGSLRELDNKWEGHKVEEPVRELQDVLAAVSTKDAVIEDATVHGQGDLSWSIRVRGRRAQVDGLERAGIAILERFQNETKGETR